MARKLTTRDYGVIALGLLGVYYLFVPHNLQERFAPDALIGLKLTHRTHQILGGVFLALAVYLWCKMHR